MAEVGAMLTSAVLKMVGEKIGSAIGGRIKLQWDFNYDLKDMKMTLETIEVFLKDAERRSIREESVRLWLRRLKNVMYNISDMIDGFEAETTRKVYMSCLTSINQVYYIWVLITLLELILNFAKKSFKFGYNTDFLVM